MHDEHPSKSPADIEESLATAKLEGNDMETQESLEVKAAKETEKVADDTNDAHGKPLRRKGYAAMMDGKRMVIVCIFQECDCRRNYEEVVEHQEKKPSGTDREK